MITTKPTTSFVLTDVELCSHVDHEVATAPFCREHAQAPLGPWQSVLLLFDHQTFV